MYISYSGIVDGDAFTEHLRTRMLKHQIKQQVAAKDKLQVFHLFFLFSTAKTTFFRSTHPICGCLRLINANLITSLWETFQGNQVMCKFNSL